jgi:hypothetical protein
VPWSLGGEKGEIMESEFPLENTLAYLEKSVLKGGTLNWAR